MQHIKKTRQYHFTVTQSLIAVAAIFLTILTQTALAASEPGGYGLKIYKVNSALYPYVQVYFRTFDERQQPLVNLNELNIGLMVKGRAYDPAKRQYRISSLRQREEATRSVLVIDASTSMAHRPFNTALEAAVRYIESKRPPDEVAILAIRNQDNKSGYTLVSEFERDPAALGRRLGDIKADGTKSRIYDTIGAAMQMCGMSSQGAVGSGDVQNYIVSCSIVVFSDGYDEGSALSREELNSRITGLAIPVPIYSLAYGKDTRSFKNLEALSKNSFGIYYLIGETVDRMQQTVEQIQNIIQSDYVLTFRSMIPVDGEEHVIKVGVEYPSGSGKYTYENAKMEALEAPPIEPVKVKMSTLESYIPALPQGAEPYFDKPQASAPQARAKP